VVGGDFMNGITLTLGGLIVGDDLVGINAGGIGMVSYEEDTGLSYFGVEAENARWITLHGIDIEVANELNGLGLSGITVRAAEIRGMAASLALVNSELMKGFSLSTVNYCTDLQVGLSIGIVNIAEELNGIQLGIINIAKNKSRFKTLPIINASFN
jgi:hypothetical protein